MSPDDDTVDLFDLDFDEDRRMADPPSPVNWDDLTADQLEEELRSLDTWVHWLRRTYGLPAAIVPPLWHRHPELLWELSALHLHWLTSYHPDQHGSAPLAWHRDLPDALHRLREWTANTGTRIDRDRPTRQTHWPGEHPQQDGVERHITDRARDFDDYIRQQVRLRGD